MEPYVIDWDGPYQGVYLLWPGWVQWRPALDFSGMPGVVRIPRAVGYRPGRRD
jgi:hypothetical protein